MMSKENEFYVGELVIIKGLVDFENKVGIVEKIFSTIVEKKYLDPNFIKDYYNVFFKDNNKTECFSVKYLKHYYKD
jgi:hypothetical protein